MSQVTLRQLSKTYPTADKTQGFAAVAEIDLEVRSGEFMVLVGPSGCGKSTTLRMIAGLEDITRGDILIDGRRVNDVEPKDRDIAMVFQNYALYPHMKVRENMAFGLKLRNLSKPEIEQRVREAAAILGLDDLLDRKPKDLSGGQRQRVAVGRAIVRKPKVFLFDEPLSNLDAKMRISMRNEISRLHAKLGATMIYVTHDQTEAMTMGDRICVMQNGHILQTAAPLEVYHRPANLFVAGFIGSPPMNLFRGSVRAAAGGHEFEFEAAANAPTLPLLGDLAQAAAQLSGRPAVLGLRPEDIGIGSPATIQAKVEFTESLGAETYLHFQGAGASFVARVPSDVNPDAGASLPLRFNLTRAHLFDPASSLALC